jgi:hypothetical protein
LAPWRPDQFITWMARPAGELDPRSERLSNLSDPCTEALDVTPWLEQKVAAALCHRSQHQMFLRNSKAASVPEMVRSTEHLRVWSPDEYLQPVSWTPQPERPPSQW